MLCVDSIPRSYFNDSYNLESAIFKPNIIMTNLNDILKLKAKSWLSTQFFLNSVTKTLKNDM